MTYRPFIKKIFWLVISSIILCLLLFYRWYLIDFTLEGFYQFLAASLFPLGLMLRAFIWVFPAIYSQFEIYDNILIRNFLGKKEEFLYSDIREVHFSWISPRFSGGYSIVFKNGRKLRLPSFLINSDVLLKKIMKSRSELVSIKKANKYLNRYIAMDAAWLRTKKKIKSFYRASFHFALIPSVFSFYVFKYRDFFSDSLEPSMIIAAHFLIAYIVLLASNSLEEFIIQNLEEKIEHKEVLYSGADWLSNLLYYAVLVSYLSLL